MELQGRHAVITGGTGALGTAVVGRLLDAGALCHVPCRSAAQAETSSSGSKRLLALMVQTSRPAAVQASNPPATLRNPPNPAFSSRLQAIMLR